MNRILKNRIAFIFLLLFLVGCKTNPTSLLKQGDLVFVTAKSSGLSGAINTVTKKNDIESFDHLGLVKKEGKRWFVLHSEPKNGSWKQDFSEFVKKQSNEGQQMVLYRLKTEFQSAIPNAILSAEKMLGKPYNELYILNENQYYCSDFIERAFRKDSIFSLQPMTFKDPKTGVTNVFWKEFYSKYGVEVPEGELGCNPNGLAASPKLVRIKVLN